MRYGIWTTLAAGLLLTAGVSQANDTVRLGGPSAQAAIQGGTDNELVRYGRGYGGGYYGGRGYYGGGRGYYGGHFGRSYGAFYGGSYYRPYYGSYSYYRPYYQPYVYSYYPSYYGGSYYSPYYASYYPCAGDVGAVVTVQGQQSVIQSQSYQPAPAPRTNVQPMLPATNGDGTFPYDGGPNRPIPMPPASDNPAPISGPRGIIPLDGKLVSLPRETGGGVSPVASPKAQGWSYVSGGNLSVQMKSTPTTTRIAYPAYGENAVPTPRKTSIR